MFKLQFKDNPHRSLWLVGEKITLGSDPGNTLVLDSLGVDEFHAELHIESDRVILKSKPGSCIVNDLPVDGEYALQANDELRIGREYLLIIDPKNPPKPVPKRRPGAAVKQTDWALIPDHAKLRELDFSIRDRAVIGRARECQFSVPYKLLSREHAELRVENGQLLLRDLGSANGSFVNGNRVEEATLANGDKVAFAKLGFTVQGPGEVRAGSMVSTAEYDALNRTMIRPAINLDVELAARGNGPPSPGMALQLEPMQASADDAKQGETASAKRLIKSMGLVLMVAVACAGVWFYLSSR